MLQDYHIINQLYLTEIYHSDRFDPSVVKLRKGGFLSKASVVDKIKLATATFIQNVIEQDGKFGLPNGEDADIKQMGDDLVAVKTPEQMQKFWDDYGLLYYTSQEHPFVIEPTNQ